MFRSFDPYVYSKGKFIHMNACVCKQRKPLWMHTEMRTIIIYFDRSRHAYKLIEKPVSYYFIRLREKKHRLRLLRAV